MDAYGALALMTEEERTKVRRDYFAGIAMNAILNADYDNFVDEIGKVQELPEILAREAVIIADALIKELNK